MNSNPSFYPKHLARQYVNVWSNQQASSRPPLQQQQQPRFDHHRPLEATRSLERHMEDRLTPPPSQDEWDRQRTVMNDEDHPRSSGNTKVFGGLPPPFIAAMKKLFDILDTDNTGRVCFVDIASNWSPDEHDSRLPPGVIPSLKKVTTADGYLTFERFCAGLKIAILRHDAAVKKKKKDDDKSIPDEESGCGEAMMALSPLSRTNSLPILPGNSPTNSDEVASYCGGKEAEAEEEAANNKAPSPAPSEPWGGERNYTLVGPPKPPRDPKRMSGVFKGLVGRAMSTNSLPASISNVNFGQHVPRQSEAPLFIWKAPPPPFVSLQANTNEPDNVVRRSGRRKAEYHHARRHTLQGGVDVAMMRRLNHWEEEKSMLEQGLQTINRAKDWYQSRLDEVNQRLRLTGDPTTAISAVEANQERLIFELCSLRELNQRLNCLVSSGKPGVFPAHINLEMESSNNNSNGPMAQLERRIERLQDQNKQLTQEVGRQSNRVTALEQEKRTLIRQLFQQSSASSTNTLSSPHVQ